MKMPLYYRQFLTHFNRISKRETHQAAPTTERPMQSPMPKLAHAYGETVSRNWPTCSLVSRCLSDVIRFVENVR